MGPENCCNLERVEYFPLEEYISRIKLNSNLLYHLEETSKDFDKYIKLLSSDDPDIVASFLINSFEKEIVDSNIIENHTSNYSKINENNIFYYTLNINHQRIKNLHKFALEKETIDDYRKEEAWVGYVKDNEKHIYWYGAEPEDIKKFMDDYIKEYKANSLSLLNSNPFLKSALITLLFIRIHPFGDGNGRTARLLYDMKFTELINKIYKTNLKISPLHISNSILLNQPSYVHALDSIYFDVKHDCNDEINKWFDFCLNMTDEQLFYLSNELKNKNRYLFNIENPSLKNESINQKIKSMKIQKLH